MSRVLLGLGSNLGDRLENLRRAVSSLERNPEVEVTARSGVYESEALDYRDQPDFLNAVVEVETALDPRGLLELAMGLETEAGRRRPFPSAPRTLDVDILVFGDLVVEEPDLAIPHPRLGERRFVLEPLLEIRPDGTLPDGRGFRELLSGIGDRQSVDRECEL